ncbi:MULTISPECIES: NAD(P)-dependent malic enzyme [Metallosphaera]|uniref:Malate dehydrogenase (Oxaloacetate-decarboxylating) (NADP(+)) n=4 Tax=Metallosphaera TaxID=41980 RepID=A4YCQ6_METS5|nr:MULTISPECIES: NADP-dependent malic enzyme [Metallosphaera]ABP94208.1 Malate dehydrogenase (oxaloacetate-decarboxylating) (NADP(+)) [Metallosphaera sedula DSM 5348]AIM26195.1 Malate dehydrogenase (oxaloacetate-decarboxylating) (NADP(+)) [Metallosphaera sedula]MCY0862548.1 NADP-dependent malic enzyme [Metallosphaera prunae]QCO30193.1 NADP-dependent malic enzyme [Metallosphaera prunae]WPX07483.1 NADP-dependent malic enzyme [Metallosphaera sedula DSM 5348]
MVVTDFESMALDVAVRYKGKIQVMPKVPVNSLNDFSILYTPGVAAVSQAIHKNRELSFHYTYRWNAIAVVTDGSRVLGLGDIGPEAAMPVMEGKALIFKFLGGVDAIPLPLGTKDADKIVETVKLLEPAFGGINLEDIESPKCFYVLERLKSIMEIPVWHDDQQGTAGATLAGLITALEITGKNPKNIKIVLFGTGAANIATARLLGKFGIPLKNIVLVDSAGVIYRGRQDEERMKTENPWKYELLRETNGENVTTIEDAFKGADVVIAASKQGPDVIKKSWIKLMNTDPIVFALANPTPEIWPEEAKEAGAKIVATGRSDFPNQVNNSLIFPGVFRGSLDVRAKAITDEMVIDAARELASHVREKGATPDYIIPKMTEWEIYPRVAAAVGVRAIQQNVARVSRNYNELFDNAKTLIEKARTQLRSIA